MSDLRRESAENDTPVRMAIIRAASSIRWRYFALAEADVPAISASLAACAAAYAGADGVVIIQVVGR